MTSLIEVDRTFVFADLSGYTALTEAHGNLTAGAVIGRYVEIAGGTLRRGASIFERVGDELVIVAGDAVAAIETALALRHAIMHERLFPMVRAGIHGGRVAERGGQYFGNALNVAARVTTQAKAGQILCTEAVRRNAPLAGVSYRPLGPVLFKNIPGAVPLFEVMVDQDAEAIHVDPVCRMQIAATGAVAMVAAGSMTYFFCSETCAVAFRSRPMDYVVPGFRAEI